MTDTILLIVNGPDSRSLHDTVAITPEIQSQLLAPLAARVEALEQNAHVPQESLDAFRKAFGKTFPSAPVDTGPAVPVGNSEFGEIAEHVAKQMPPTGWTGKDTPSADDAAVGHLMAWSQGYEYYYDAYCGPDAPLADERPDASALCEAIQAGARLVPLAIRKQEEQIAALRAELVAAKNLHAQDVERLVRERDALRKDLTQRDENQALQEVVITHLNKDKGALKDHVAELNADRNAWKSAEMVASKERDAAVKAKAEAEAQIGRLTNEVESLHNLLASKDHQISKLENENASLLNMLASMEHQRDSANKDKADAVELLRELLDSQRDDKSEYQINTNAGCAIAEVLARVGAATQETKETGVGGSAASPG